MSLQHLELNVQQINICFMIEFVCLFVFEMATWNGEYGLVLQLQCPVVVVLELTHNVESLFQSSVN